MMVNDFLSVDTFLNTSVSSSTARNALINKFNSILGSDLGSYAFSIFIAEMGGRYKEQDLHIIVKRIHNTEEQVESTINGGRYLNYLLTKYSNKLSYFSQFNDRGSDDNLFPTIRFDKKSANTNSGSNSETLTHGENATSSKQSTINTVNTNLQKEEDIGITNINSSDTINNPNKKLKNDFNSTLTDNYNKTDVKNTSDVKSGQNNMQSTLVETFNDEKKRLEFYKEYKPLIEILDYIFCKMIYEFNTI